VTDNDFRDVGVKHNRLCFSYSFITRTLHKELVVPPLLYAAKSGVY